MNRRQWLTVFASALAVLRWPRQAHAQGSSYARAVQSAFTEFAAAPASIGRIAPTSEPGVPLVVKGTLFRADGRTPLPGALVFAYHTDQHGLYNVESGDARLAFTGRCADRGRRLVRVQDDPARLVPADAHPSAHSRGAADRRRELPRGRMAFR